LPHKQDWCRVIPCNSFTLVYLLLSLLVFQFPLSRIATALALMLHSFLLLIITSNNQFTPSCLHVLYLTYQQLIRARKWNSLFGSHLSFDSYLLLSGVRAGVKITQPQQQYLNLLLPFSFIFSTALSRNSARATTQHAKHQMQHQLQPIAITHTCLSPYRHCCSRFILSPWCVAHIHPRYLDI
jgi:hypothetical protein